MEEYHALLELMKNDKKNSKSNLNFTLLKEIGSATFNHPVETALIIDAFDFYNTIYS